MDQYQVCCGIMSALTAVDLTVLTQAFTMGGTGVKTFASAALAHGTHMLADAATSARATLAASADLMPQLRTNVLAQASETVTAAPKLLDPMYWLGADSPFGHLILPGLGLIIFVETGLGFPLLPGDSLLFTAGMLANQHNGFAPVWQVLLVAIACAIAGDQSSYWIGRKLGDRIRKRPDGRIFKKAYITEGEAFFKKWGALAVILCRFVPIVRTYAPMTIGMARMNYARFFLFDICGGFLWAGGVTVLGVWLGSFTFVRENIELIFLAIVFISILPGIIGAIKKSRASKRATTGDDSAAPLAARDAKETLHEREASES